MVVFASDKEVAGIGYESDRLTQNEHRVEANQTVADNHGRAHEAHGPESDRQARLAVARRVEPLVDEAQRENRLPYGAEEQQPEGHLVVLEEVPHEGLGMAGDGHERRHGREEQHSPQQQRNAAVESLQIEVPEVDVVGNQLPEDDGEVVAQPSVEEEQPRPGQRTYPVGRGRDDAVRPLREDPLDEDARREEELRQKADGVNPPHGLQVGGSDPVVDGPLAHPAVGEAVHQRGDEPVPEVELRGAGRARVVRHGGFGIGGTLLQQNERRQEAVHPLEEGQAFGRRRLHHLERAARVGGAVVGHHPAERVGELRLEALEERVLASGADARGELMLDGQRQQPLEILGMGLQVGVDVAHQRRLGVVDTGLERGAQPGVAYKGEVVEVGVAGADALQQLEASVRRAVVDEEHAAASRCRGEVVCEGLLEPVDVVPLVVDGDNNRKFVFRCMVHVRIQFFKGFLSERYHAAKRPMPSASVTRGWK